MMAKYQDVMRQWKRMCAAMYNCDMCPLNEVECWASEPGELEEDFKAREDIIMKWAAEYPESVYPTWWEFLLMNGAIGRKTDNYTIGELVRQYRIPADIAQKYGIEPEEVR